MSNLYVFRNEEDAESGVGGTFVASVGENVPALREAGFSWGGRTAHALAGDLRNIAEQHQTTHGRYWPRLGQETDVGHVAATLANALDRHRDGPVAMKTGGK